MAHPLIPSVKRRGRLTTGQRRTLREHDEHLAEVPDCEQLHRLFGRSADLVLDIGFGDGVATLAMAQAQPQRDILAVELYPAGVAQLLAQLTAHQIPNVRVITADARHVLAAIPERSLAEVRVFFPDPWPKARHHKRRLLGPAVIASIAARLRPGGLLHVATDWADYAEQIAELLQAEPLLIPRPGQRGLRPVTRFEQRAHEADRDCTDLWAIRGDCSPHAPNLP
ncbi:MAG: tRNA (guanosine(46)-N7)-methyltransferase TrmB [Angustibacter sp.]